MKRKVSLLEAATLLHTSARILVPHDLGETEATVIALGHRTDPPHLVAITDAGHKVRVAVDGQPIARPAGGAA